MKIISILAAFLVLVLGACNPPNLGNSLIDQNDHNSEFTPNEVFSMVIETDTGVGGCSGTAISDRVFLTASHCMKDNIKLITLRNDFHTIELRDYEVIRDTMDNALIVMKDPTFPVYVKFDFNRNFKKGERVHIFGNPSGLFMLRREGYFMGYVLNSKSMIMFPMWDMNIYRGDSGSCMFDKDNICISVVSYMTWTPDGLLKIAGTTPFTFTEEQLKGAGL